MSNTKTIQELTIEADRGDGWAMVELGWRYYNGDGVAANKNMARYWFEKPAAQRFIDGRYGLAKCMLHGDAEKAWSMMKALAEEGHTGARLDLARYWKEKDKAAAVMYYLQAAQHSTQAQYELGSLYEYSNKVYSQAFYWYQKAVENGHKDAIAKLGTFYFEGKGDVEKDYTKAYQLAVQSANAGSFYGYCLLGRCYYHGYGVGQDYTEALRWFRKTYFDETICMDRYEAGYEAQYYIGLCYRNGYGVPKDEWEAVKYFEGCPDPRATTALAMHHLFYSPYRNVEKGISLLQNAVFSGERLAMLQLGIYYDNGENGLPRNREKAVELYKQSAELGCTGAQRKLGDYYANSNPPEMELARYWYACADELRFHKPGREPKPRETAPQTLWTSAVSAPAAKPAAPVPAAPAVTESTAAPVLNAAPPINISAMTGRELYHAACDGTRSDQEKEQMIEAAVKKGHGPACSGMALIVCRGKATRYEKQRDFKSAVKYYSEAIDWQKKYIKYLKKETTGGAIPRAEREMRDLESSLSAAKSMAKFMKKL